MTELIEITNNKSNFIKKKIMISSDSEPTTPDLTITSKIVPNINLQVRIGFDIGFISDGQIKIIKNESQEMLPDNEIAGLSEVDTGTILTKNGDFFDLKIWNTSGGEYEIIILIFINSTSEGIFVDPLAILEATTKTEILLNTGISTASSYTKNFNMQGYKALNLTLGVNLGLGNISIHDNSDGWTSPTAAYTRENTTTNKLLGGSNKEIIYDCGEEITGILTILSQNIGSGNSHIEIEVSTDDISYSNILTTSNLIASPGRFDECTSSTFRYIKIIGVFGTLSPNVHISGIGLKNSFGTTVDLKFQNSFDGITWTDFILSSEYDTTIGLTGDLGETFNISRDNPSLTSKIYLLPQGNNKLRIVITLTKYAGISDSTNLSGYMGIVSVEKLN